MDGNNNNNNEKWIWTEMKNKIENEECMDDDENNNGECAGMQNCAH